MDDRYTSQPQRPRDRDRDRDRDSDASRMTSRPAPRSEPRSQVRLKIPDSVIDDDGSDVRDDSSRHGHHRSHHTRDENGASDRPALRRQKSVDLERKTSRQNEDFRRRRNELEAQEAGAMRRSEDRPSGYERRGESRDGDGKYGGKELGRDRRDDRDRDRHELVGGGGDRIRDDGRRRGDRGDRSDRGDRGHHGDRGERGERSDRGDRDDRRDRHRRDDGAGRGGRDGRDDVVMDDNAGSRHHGNKRHHDHRREEGRTRDDELRRDDDGRRDDRPRRDDDGRRDDRPRRDDDGRRDERSRRDDESRRGDEPHRGENLRRGGETRDAYDRESESRRHKKRDGLDGPDAISDAVSYGSDPVDQLSSRDDGGRRKQGSSRPGGVIDLDEMLEKPAGGAGRWTEKGAGERDPRPMPQPAYDLTSSRRRPRDVEDRPRSEKPGYYDSHPSDGRQAADQIIDDGYARARPPMPIDLDTKYDRERR